MEDYDTRLMLEVKKGSRQAFEEIVARYQDTVLNIIYRFIGNSSDAEDLAQEVFLRVYKARKSYKPISKFSTWLYRITANLCLNELRDRKRRGIPLDEKFASLRPGVSTEAQTPLKKVVAQELAQAVRQAVLSLPEKQRLALILNKYQGLSYKEIAALLSTSVPAVKSLLSRAREGLKERLLKFMEEG